MADIIYGIIFKVWEEFKSQVGIKENGNWVYEEYVIVVKKIINYPNHSRENID